ncbi:MAG TPA: hypothetical protein VFD92_03095 [Candidatus Binatia bacterium]|nr:hypothetical protein [Candidatus Binatia bacterium]
MVAVQLLEACGFHARDDVFDSPQHLYDILNGSPYVEDATVSGERHRVIDEPKLKVDHGYTCAGALRAASKEFLGSRAFDSATLPDGFNGTVFLNGWSLGYSDTDHHVLGLGAVIFNIAQNGNVLSWDAGGLLSDRKGDDPYDWCYQYTIVAWAKDFTRPGQLPKPHIDMKATHSDSTGKLIFVDRSLDASHRTMPAKLRVNPKPRAKLLAGFGVGFGDDHHQLLQFGFDVGESTIKRKKIKWTTDVVLKNDSNHDVYGAEIATILSGRSVQVWKPQSVLLESGHPDAPGFLDNDLKLEPWSGSNVCVGSTQTRNRYAFKIEGVPFTWAVPMLTGWEVGDQCSDQFVKTMGAWIEDWSWERNPGDSTGTLRYTISTVFEDEHPDTGIANGMQVEILGLDMVDVPVNGAAAVAGSADGDASGSVVPGVEPERDAEF